MCLCGAARCRNKYIFQIFIFEAIHILFLFSDDPIIGLACFMLSFQAVPHRFFSLSRLLFMGFRQHEGPGSEYRLMHFKRRGEQVKGDSGAFPASGL